MRLSESVSCGRCGRSDEFADAQCDGIDGELDAVVADGDDAVGFAGGDLLVGGVDAAVEVVGLALEAVLVGALLWTWRWLRRRARASEASSGGSSRRVRSGWRLSQTAACMARMRSAAECAAGALVGLGGVGEAVAEDDGAGGEGGLDDLGDGLGAVGEHEGHLGERGDGAESGFGAGVEQDGADAVAEGG